MTVDRISVFFAAAFFSSIQFAFATELSPQQQAMFANILAQKFSDVCVKTFADEDVVANMAKESAWKKRPAEITTMGSGLAHKAWDATASFIPFSAGQSKATIDFEVGVKQTRNEKVCTFILPELPFSTLLSSLKNQGFLENNKFEHQSEDYTWKNVTLCAPKIHHKVEALGNPRPRKRHGIFLESRDIPERQWLNGSRFTYVIEENVKETGCPPVIYLGSTGPSPEPIKIEPWLGQKPMTVPPTLVDE